VDGVPANLLRDDLFGSVWGMPQPTAPLPQWVTQPIRTPWWLAQSVRRFLQVTAAPVLLLLALYGWEKEFGLGGNLLAIFFQGAFWGFPVLIILYRRAACLDHPPALARSRWRGEGDVLFHAVIHTLGAYGVCSVVIWWLFSGTFLATFAAPAHPENKIIFEVDVLRDFPVGRFFAQRVGQAKMQLGANLFERVPDLVLGHAQWSKDGQLFVCTAAVEDQLPVPAMAFDFSTNQALRPEWKESPPDATGRQGTRGWNMPAAEIQKLITEHGGLVGPIIDRRQIEQAEKKYWGVVKFDVRT